MTYYAPKAHEIADKFRRCGNPAIFGGAHSTYRPDESPHHGGSIVCREAEGLWSPVIDDVEAWGA